MPSALASGAGVQVPGGDTGALQGAADYHYQLADGLEYHAGTMDSTATALYHAWSGEAAGSYQMLSSQVVAHYRSAAGTARDVGDALRSYAAQLRQYQQEGLTALHQAVYWLEQVRQWEGRLRKAQAEVQTAQRTVQHLQSQVNAASSLGPVGDSAAGAANAQLTAAQGQLHRAQNDVRTCQEELRNAEHQLLGWQRRGGQIWQEAQQAADRATGTLDATCVVTPPLAALPVPQPHHSGGSFWSDVVSVAAVAVPVITDVLGGGPEDPVADGLAMAEREALQSAGGDAVAAGTASSEAVGAGEGPGAWVTANESMSARAATYQEQIAGRAGSVYEVNGVKFDAYENGVLQDAKGPGYSQFVRNQQFVPWFRGADALVSQAERQLAAAGGTPISWSVAEPEAATAIRNLFAENGISGINVNYVPPVP